MHDLQLIAADGQPIVPLTLSNLLVGAAERYDALVTIESAGSFTLQAVGARHRVAGPWA